MPLAATLSQVAAASGYGRDDPLVVAVGRSGHRPTHLARGCFAPGADGVVACAVDPGRGGPTTTTLVYMASLAKQVTAACAALLVRDGVLDLDAPVASVLPGLPPWSRQVRIRHLVHHTGGLPLDGVTGPDRTTAAVLADARDLDFTPGTRYSYSNVGYVWLAEAVGAAAGEPLPDFARRRVFAPLGMADTLFWAGPDPRPPGAAPLDPPRPAPLSIGDGGLWSTAADMLRWAGGLTGDRLGITALVQTPGALDDGTPLNYAWGMGVRSYGGHPAYRHGGAYADVRTMLVRVPERGLDLLVLALADRSDRRTGLTDRLLPVLIGPA
jgi:CubicO group peptidase (beta-lactamase class C family)